MIWLFWFSLLIGAWLWAGGPNDLPEKEEV